MKTFVDLPFQGSNPKAVGLYTLVILLCVLSVTNAISMDPLNNATKVGLVYLGTVDGKAFFTEQPTVRKTWTAAQEQCSQANMQIASITTLQQERFILETLKKMPDIYVWSWTAGRIMELDLSMFSWDGPNTTVSSGMGFRDYTSAAKICLGLYSGSAITELYGALDCTATMGVICEISN